MTSSHTLQVDKANNELRLDVYLTKNIPEIPSRTFVKRLIDSGKVTVNGRKVKVHHKVAFGEEVCVEIPPVENDDDIQPEDIALNIFYEDGALLVIDKPIGMLVHPANKNSTGTLVNALLHHCRELSDVNTKIRPGIVHRLDKETSGLLLVAKDNRTHTKLAKQFERHLVKKQYIALAEGDIEFDEGVIDVSLGRHPRYHDRKVVAFDDAAKQAKTFYRVVKRFNDATLVHLFPKTGRTHQLRVHLTHLGHPILGDDKYGKRNSYSRLALHAQSIGFVHPVTNKYIEFSTKPPREFLEYSGKS